MVASTQGDSISEQLGKGVRYLDIRLDSDMDVNHSGIVCYINILKKLKLKNVLDDVSDFLKQHPTETVIIQIKKEGKGSHEETFIDEVDNVLENYKLLYKKSKNVRELKLSDVRGKFIVFSRDKHPKFSYPFAGWPDDCDFAEIKLGNSRAFLHDKYSIKDANDKFQSIESFYNKIWKNKNDLGKSYIINFISCIGYYMPKQVASSVNKKFQNFVNKNKDKKFGIVLMDNPSLENIETLYSTNF